MEPHDPTPPKDYYKILEVDYDATDDKIRLNYRKLALKWHPDKHKGDGAVTSKFQEINEAYSGEVLLTFNDLSRHLQHRALGNRIPFLEVYSSLYTNEVLSDPVKRFDYDLTGIYEIEKYTLREYLARFKGMILTCNGLGISHPSEGAEHLTNGSNIADEKGYVSN